MLNEITRNPLLVTEHALLRERLLKEVPQLTNCTVDAYLLLGKYFEQRPWTFFCRESFTIFNSWLENQDVDGGHLLLTYIKDRLAELNTAFHHLDEVNRYDPYDTQVGFDDMAIVRLLDHTIHPTYLRLCEAVWTPFLRIAAYVSRLNRGKRAEGLDASNIYEELKNGDLAMAVTHFNATIRNGIAHGGTEYRDNDIWYHDKRCNSESLSGREMIRLCDDMLDTCNGLAFGLAVFLLIGQSRGYKLPQQLLFEELRAQTATAWWKVDACIPWVRSERTQLTIYVHADTYDEKMAQLSAFQTGILAGLLAPGYDRYFLNIQSKKARIAMAAFNGSEIAKLSNKADATYQDCENVIDDGLFGYLPKVRLPRLIQKLNTFIMSFRLHWPRYISEMRRQLGRPNIDCRDAKIHRNGWRTVLNAQVYLTVLHRESVDHTTVRRFRRRIVRHCLRAAKRDMSRLNVLRYLPLGFARISVFRTDYRRRRLTSFGLGPDLVCTIQTNCIRRIQIPDISGSTIETKGGYRIAWNRSWTDHLESD